MFSKTTKKNNVCVQVTRIYSLRSRRLEEVVVRKNGRSRGRHDRCAHYFHAPATQSTRNKDWGTSVQIPCWWRVTTHIWIVLLIGWSKISLATRLIRSTRRIWVVTSHQYRISAVVLQMSLHGENQWWPEWWLVVANVQNSAWLC